MADLANIVTLRAKLGKTEQLGDALKILIAQTRKEPGSTVCELHQAAEDDATWMVYERWTGEAAFAGHMRAPYVADFLARVDDLVREPPSVRAFHHRK